LIKRKTYYSLLRTKMVYFKYFKEFLFATFVVATVDRWVYE
jgi:hypothetical protein